MVDATIIPVPIQHNSAEENEEIKEGKIPQEWSSKKSKLSQKDRDAHWLFYFHAPQLEDFLQFINNSNFLPQN
ncbi:hypothetical protein MICAH_10004 [Microcystis aeruginosa PCC 9809]|jgi:hypothetical protein|uniref:Transposase n=1 Tax=Microcystis aeruginosa PCC 9809 TaxID=1160285 RepID=I4HFW9_MICAE|nr:hypothetical protein [Microcystis aeruginosa]CCI20943.1 hypothetical protein MICAH_10004 [Microcystis aeruginosa PCC 9809]